MKTIKVVAMILLVAGLFAGTTSCTTLVVGDRGVHNGWYKSRSTTPTTTYRVGKPAKGNPHKPGPKKHGKGFISDINSQQEQ